LDLIKERFDPDSWNIYPFHFSDGDNWGDADNGHCVDLVRKRSADATQVHPLEPLKAMIEDFMRRGGTLWACTPCVKARGYEQADLIEGVVIIGASAVHERLKAGAATLSF